MWSRSACSTSIKWDLSSFEVCIGPVNMKNRAVSLPTTVPPLMGHVKVKYVVVENESGIGVHLCSDGRNAYEQLQSPMNSEGMLYHFPFQRLVEDLGNLGGDTSECVHAVFFDSSCSSSQLAEISNS